MSEFDKNKINLTYDKKTVICKMINTITGDVKKQVAEIIKTKPVNELTKKFQKLYVESDDENLNDREIGLKLLKSGEIDGDDIIRFQDGDYIPDDWQNTTCFYLIYSASRL